MVLVPLSDEKEIERRVLEKKKKKDLLSRYVSEGLVEEQTEAKDMLNIQHDYVVHGIPNTTQVSKTIM